MIEDSFNLTEKYRYDKLLNEFRTPDKGKNEPSRAVVLQISVERIAASVLTYHRTSQGIQREPKTFGYWSPRRCDVYVVSFSSGHFNDRLEVAGLLWKNGISADVMYESGLTGNEDQMALCDDEGVLFVPDGFLRWPRCAELHIGLWSTLDLGQLDGIKPTSK